MDWKRLTSGFNGKMNKEKWILLLLAGIFLMILSMPLPGTKRKEQNQTVKTESWKQEPEGKEEVPVGPGKTQTSEADGVQKYEEELENRIREILSSVKGVGEVDVMVALSSSGEKVFRVDRSDNKSSTKETDASGGQREVVSSQSQETTLLSSSSGSGNTPVVEKELTPEISGIIISAQGGDSPAVQAEISEAMEALFGLPPHKIKVLKRVE